MPVKKLEFIVEVFPMLHNDAWRVWRALYEDETVHIGKQDSFTKMKRHMGRDSRLGRKVHTLHIVNT